jgi:SAM-dependent methyltransferase
MEIRSVPTREAQRPSCFSSCTRAIVTWKQERGNGVLSSMVCRYEHFREDWYRHWAERLHLEPPGLELDSPDRNINRKAWEWCAILAALQERGMLHEGRSGLGFAVGKEPVPSILAAHGVEVLGTDLGADEAGWSSTNEYAQSADHLYHPALVDKATFDKKVRFLPADMRDIGGFSDESFDFVWSSCSFEHLGSLETGIGFVKDAMRLVKPGGFAVHTTEFNVASNTETLVSGGSVIYRKRDIEALDYILRRNGAALEKVDFDPGSHPHDIDYDFPPYFKNGRKHLKLLLGDHITTSIILIIQKGNHPPPT